METMHQQTAALSVADDHQPFRLFNLPAELRVRIYECFFEPSPQCNSPAEIDLLEVKTIKYHAPDLAILATSHLVRREAYDIAKQAERKYFQDTRFTLEFSVPHNAPPRQVKTFTPGLCDTMAAVASLPYFPIICCEELLDAFCLHFNIGWADRCYSRVRARGYRWA
ncbi:hypothetical protein LTR49_025305 [Elasticomyces elasticus]|nr:hypothetical protein LTR49_025305 [Elasticomyces elasticus]